MAKVIRYVLIGFILFVSCKGNKVDYDVIIVGGGLAGLSAAASIDSHRVLLIEKDSVLGGRVRTHNFNEDLYYDVGAVFSLDTSYRNKFPIDEEEIIEDKPIAFWIDGVIYKGEDVYDCLRKIPGVDSLKIKNYIGSKTFDSRVISKELYDILNTNIKAVMPGSLNEYNFHAQKFAFRRYNSSHFLWGNQLIIDSLLKDKKYNIKISTEVLSVIDIGEKVLVVTSNEFGGMDSLFSKKVIVATPATAARKIVKKINPETRTFLEGVKYAGYYSVSIGVRQEVDNLKLAYLLPVNTGFSSVLKQKTKKENMNIFQLYIAEEDFPMFEDEKDIQKKAIRLLKNIWGIESANILFQDVYFWKEAGVIVNEHYRKKWEEDYFWASKNVILAGDYCMIKYEMPYGMIPAMESGKRAAKVIAN